MNRNLFFCLLTLLGIALHVDAKQFELRLLNHWDNPNGTVERGFAGRSIWKWDEIPEGKGKMPAALRARYEEYGRINQEYGINGTVLNNVNAKPLSLSTPMLRKTAKIADVLRPYGIRVYLSVNFASPKALGDLTTADPLDADVQQWWQRKCDEIYRLIPDFGGFLVKANSEGEPGPMDYGRTHVDGANMLAAALKPHGGIVMWRAFVYAAKSGDVQKTPAQQAYESDRANQAYEEFIRFDGQFSDNVIIQIKNGPIDFQPREPVSPLFFALKKTKMMVEFQITQEYTGESIHTCFLAPMWREFFNTLSVGLSGCPALLGSCDAPSSSGASGVVGSLGSPGTSGVSGVSSISGSSSLPPNLIGAAGVANIGDSPNWTASDLARANWYAFARLANDPSTPSRTIAEDFLRKYYTTDERFVLPVAQLLLRSREAVVDYMMPLGIHHIFAGGHHYGPEPWYAPRGMRADWTPPFYHRADSIGLGFNRTDHSEPCRMGNYGSNNVSQYPEPLRTLYNDLSTCPEELLLWFHHVSWTHEMTNGLTLWENLCYTYDRGVRQAQAFVDTWKSVKPYITSEQYDNQLWRFERQAKDAQWWRDACLLYFQQFSGMPLPPDSPAPRYTLQQLQNYHLDMDMYTAADPARLP